MQIAKWPKLALDQMPEFFADGRRKGGQRPGGEHCAVRGDRSAQGRVGLAQKKLAGSTDQLRPLADCDHDAISVRRQCELLGLNVYYTPTGQSEENLRLVQWIDEHTATPFFG